MSEPRIQTVVSAITRRQSVEAVVHRACKRCAAPAFYSSEASIRDGWPKCWVPPGDPREKSLVGERCPNCGAFRPPPEDKGEIWAREHRAPPLGQESWRKHLGVALLVLLMAAVIGLWFYH